VIPTFTVHSAFDRMPRHRHGEAYVALVLAGGYVEAGDRGRLRLQAGQAVFHDRHESHCNEFFGRGAQVLNLPVPAGGFGHVQGQVADADAIARLAEHDLAEAAELLRATFCPCTARLDDWPDALASALADDPALKIAAWADSQGIAPQSISRGFRRAYGTTPKRYRLELRAVQALRRLPGWRGSMAMLAAETGFADQAHMTRAIVAMSGVAPTHLVRQVRWVKSVQDPATPPP
jgi:AraC-like DNA-binding protein